MHRTSGDSVIIDCSQVPRGGPMPAWPWARSWIPPVASMRSARQNRIRRCFRLMWVLVFASTAWFYLGSWNYLLSATHELQRESDGSDINVQGLQGGRGGAFEGVRVVMAETLIGEGQSGGNRQGNSGKGLGKISATQERFKEARGGRSHGEMEVREEGEGVLEEVGDGVDVERRAEDRHGRQGSGDNTRVGGGEGSLLGMATAKEEAAGLKVRVPFSVQPRKAAVPGPRAKEQAENGSLEAGAKGGGEAAEDDAIRCRMSRICDGSKKCGSGADTADDLRCVSAGGERQQHIREAILWSWKGYKRGAWGQDELLPLSSSSHQWFGLGLTLVDSLDTLLLAGLDHEYREARDWVLQHLNLKQGRVNLFEVTIRVLAGLLSASHLAGGDLQLAALALQLGLRLLPAFDTGTGIPLSDAHLTELKGYNPEWTQASSLSEVTTLSLEYSTLAQLAQREDLRAPAMRVWSVMNGMDGRVGGLAPIFVDPWTARYTTSVISLGARGDSYYEYMLKQWILSGKQDELPLKMYKECMGTVRRELLQKSRPGRDGLLYVAEMHNRQLVNKFDHLVCFLPGLLALGHFHGVSTLPDTAGDESDGESFRYLDDLTLAQELMHTCYQLYRRTPAGLAPEIAFFSGVDDSYPKQHLLDVGGGDFTVKPRDSHNLLRPETVESLFVLFRVTRQQRYRDWGWNIFRAFQKHCRVDQGGYANLDSVLNLPVVKRDKMESFWLGETLKYLWLLFSDDASLLPLEDYVFNTEAHPLPVRGRAADNVTSAALVRALAQLPNAVGKLDRDSLQQQIDAVARAAAAARPS